MTANAEEHKFTAPAIQETIDNLLYCCRVYGINVQQGLLAALSELEDAECASVKDALAFIAIGRSISEQSFQDTSDLAALYNVHRICDWYIGVGVTYLQSIPGLQGRVIHACNDTEQ